MYLSNYGTSIEMVAITNEINFKTQMKKILFAVLFGVASLSSISTQAQVSVNINIGSQPKWGPAGYNHVEYYYLPDLDVYYNVPSSQYVYQNNGRWVWNKNLPSRYRGYDLYNSYKVVMNTKQPYLSHNTHVKQYSQYKNKKGKQVNLRDSKNSKYANGRSDRNTSPERGNGSQKNDRGNNGNSQNRGHNRQ